MKRLLAAAFIVSLFHVATPALAQTQNAVVVNTCGTRSYPSGQSYPLTQDTTGLSCTGATFSGTITATTAANASASAPTYTPGSQPLSQDLSGGLRVNCTVGCAGGNFNNNADGVATSSTNGQSASWLYGFNGTTFDRVRVDTNKFLSMNLGDVGGSAIALGSTTSSASMPVVIASDQAAVAAKQSGTWTVQPGNSPNTTPWLMSINAGGNTATVSAGGALKVDGSAATQPISGTVTANAGTGTFNVACAACALETGGNLATTATNTGTIAGAVTSSVMQSNTKQVNGVTTLTGAGATGTGAQRVTVAQDTTTIAGSAPGTAGSASANVVTVQGVASMTPVQITQVATSTMGVSTKSIQVANNTTSVAVDASAGTLLAVRVFNNSGTIAYAKFYNASQGSTTCGSGTPILREMIPANSSGGSGAIPVFGGGYGVAFGTAITVCVTTGFGDSDTTAPAASTYIVEADYK